MKALSWDNIGMFRSPDREQRRDLYMLAGLILAALGYSHTLGYWPHGVSASNAPVPGGPVLGVQWGQFLYALPLLAMGGLYFLGRRAGRLAPIKKRIDELDTRIGTLVTAEALSKTLELQQQYNTKQGEIHDVFSASIADLAKDRTKAIAERSDLSIRISDALKLTRLIPNHAMRQIELTELIESIRQCSASYARIRSLRPKLGFGHKTVFNGLAAISTGPGDRRRNP